MKTKAINAWLDAAIAPENRTGPLSLRDVAELDQALCGAGGDPSLLLEAGGLQAISDYTQTWKNPAAVALGRRGGSKRSEAKTRAARANAKGPPTHKPLRTIAGHECHADTRHVGSDYVNGRPVVRALSLNAERWLRRHGWTRGADGWTPAL